MAGHVDEVDNVCEQPFQQDLRRGSVLLMNSDAKMERALNRDIVVTVNITVLTAPTSSTAVRTLCLYVAI